MPTVFAPVTGTPHIALLIEKIVCDLIVILYLRE